MKAGELGAWRGPLGAALAAFWVVYYIWLAWAQPIKEEVLRTQKLPLGVTLQYAQPPPWPAVEWNLWMEWSRALPLQAAFYALFLLASSAARGGSPAARGRSPLGLAVVGFLCAAILRGLLGAVLTLLITVLFHRLAADLTRQWVMPACWACAVLLMQAVFTLLVVDGQELCQLERLIPSLAALPPLLGLRGVASWSTFRYDALRLISFCGDVVAGEAPARLDALVAYQLYPPLAPAGPVLCYGDFVGQLQTPRLWPPRKLAIYFLRTVAVLLAAEASLYVWHFPAWLGPLTPRGEIRSMSPWVIFGAVHWCLQFEWLTLMAIWRLPRFVALLDGVEAPEDMLGPIWSPRSFRDVWRLWHASMNLWGARYIYRPLGGGRRPWLAVPATFCFVAFWHDIRGFGDRPYWYVWAAMNSLFLVLESSVFGRDAKLQAKLPWHAVGAAGVGTVLALVVSGLPAIMYDKSFSMVGAMLLGPGSSLFMLTLALALGAAAVFEASRPQPVTGSAVDGAPS